MTLLSVAVGWVSFRSARVRLVTEGEPIVLVQDGHLIERNLRRERLTRGDLEEEARKQQISSLDDIRFGNPREERVDQRHPEVLIDLAPTARRPRMALSDTRTSRDTRPRVKAADGFARSQEC
jgi:Protein of unknown function (DUF421)